MRMAVVHLTGGQFSGGYRKYVRVLTPLIRQDPRVRELTVFVPPAAAGEYPEARTWKHRDHLVGLRDLRRQIRELAPDVVFIPTARWIDCEGIPTVVMVRNMEPLEVPFAGNDVGEILRNLGRRLAARRACNRATRVIAVSCHVRDYLVGKWQISPDKISVVYHGVDRSDRHERPASLKGMDRPFLFTAGSLRPARGLDDALCALSLPDAGGLPPLVIAGEARNAAYERRLRRDTEWLRADGRIIWAGQLRPSEMAWCFQNATAVVITSRAEACPNTVLEAMSAGAPSVSTDCPPMPEFFRDAALYYAAGRGEGLAGQLVTVCGSAETRERLHAAALIRAADFTWSETAVRTVTAAAEAISS